MSFVSEQVPTDAVAVTPSDTTAVDFVGLYVGGAGDVAVVTRAGSATTFKSVPAGALLPFRCNIVKATGTTATNIVGFKS